MRTLADLELYHLDWDNPQFAANPWPQFEAARAVHPWLATCPAGHVVFELRAIRDLMGNDRDLRPAFDGVVEFMAARGRPWGRFAEEQMIALPEREHALMRATFAAKFTPRYATQLRPLMREVIHGLLAEFVALGSFDFEALAARYPVSVLTRMIGASPEVIPGLLHSMEVMGLAFAMDRTKLDDLDAAFCHMDDFVSRLVAERRAAGPGAGEGDLLDLLIGAAGEGGISDRQLADLLIFLFVAGYDTSKNVLTWTMRMLIENPRVLARCAGDPDYCRKTVEEALRLFNPGSAFRIASEDIFYRDVLIPRGTMLFFTLNVAGRDPTAHPDPAAFEPERAVDPALRHVAFGLGRHMCLGQYIARALLQEGVQAIAETIRAPRLTGEPGYRPFPGVWGHRGLPIAVEPAGEMAPA